MINRLNLLWRVLGGNIILIIIGLILLKSCGDNARYLLYVNSLTVIIVTLQIIMRKLSFSSESKDILTVYTVCLTVVNYCNITTSYQCIISLVCSMVSTLWIVNFVLIKKLIKC